MPFWDRLIERQIRKAELEGQFDNLPDAGKPLPNRPEEAMVDMSEAVGFRIMAQAGALPQEIILNKAIAAKRSELAQITDPDLRKPVMAELSDLMMRHAIAMESRKSFLRS